MTPGALPPPPGTARQPGCSTAITRPAGYVAAVLAVIGGAMWLASFLPGWPTAGFWPVVVFPCFLLTFPIFGLMVFDQTLRRNAADPAALVPPTGLPTRGWRATLAGCLFAAVVLSFLGTMVGGRLTGQPEEIDGRYWSNNHGTRTELSRDEWAEQNALASRLFAGGVLAFAGIAALSLTAPDEDRRPAARAVESRWGARQRHLSALDRWRGFAPWHLEVPGAPEDVLDRLRRTVPLQASPGTTSSSWRVTAEWREAARWPIQRFPMRLECTVSSASGTTSVVDGLVGPATTSAAWTPLQAVWGVVVVGIGVAVFVLAGGPRGFGAFILVWALWGLFLVFQLATVARRVAQATVARLSDAAAG